MSMPDGEIIYSLERQPAPEQVQRLLRQTHWANTRTVEGIATMLERSRVVGAWHGDELVGFARFLTDWQYRAMIDDVIVDGNWRSRGVGAGLIKAILRELDAVEEVLLFCDDNRVSFYEQFGFRHVEANGMTRIKPE